MRKIKQNYIEEETDLYKCNYGRLVYTKYSLIVNELLRKILLLGRDCHGGELRLDNMCGRHYISLRGYDRDKEIEIRNKIREITGAFHKKHPEIVRANDFDWEWRPEPLYYIG